MIFLDGAKNWTTDGLTVLIAEKLLRPGGWLLLDDLGWSYAKHAGNAWHYGVELGKLSDEERAEPHLRAVFELLIRTNPAFDQFLIQDDWWGWARKSPGGVRRQLRRLRRMPARLGRARPPASPARLASTRSG